MADIKQAAKWMQEGKQVRSPRMEPGVFITQRGSWIHVCEDKYRSRPLYPLDSKDLLADDWEIVDTTSA